jgi:hypothetical protein
MIGIDRGMNERGFSPPRRRGRPARDPEGVKRSSVNLRTSRGLYERICESAAAAGRSLAQEIQTRMEEAYAREAAYGGARLAAVLRRMAATARTIELRYQRSPLHDRVAFNALRRAWIDIIDDERPAETTASDAPVIELPVANVYYELPEGDRLYMSVTIKTDRTGHDPKDVERAISEMRTDLSDIISRGGRPLS